jgi:chaperone modulatory protein CbpM
MMRIDAVIARSPRLDGSRIADWVARGWVHAEGRGPTEWTFHDVDIARLHLLHDLLIDLAMDEESVPVVLSLLDQIYGLRRTLGTVMQAINASAESAEVRTRIVAILSRSGAAVRDD